MRLPHSASRLRWRLPNEDSDLEPVPGVHRVIRQILASRGIDEPKAVRAFLDRSAGPANPFALADMDAAVSRIRAAIQADEPIAVYGDFDADGVSATALLVETLRALHAQVTPYLPHREREGYGVHEAALEQLAEQGVRLVITVDCGIRAAEAVRSAAVRGLDVIVTDHHVMPEELPQAVAVINPHRPDCRYGYTGLAGVGLAFKLAQALLRVEDRAPMHALRPQLREEDLYDLVALGTVADVVPLLGENRALVQRGIEHLKTRTRPGLKALLDEAEVPPGRITARTLGWTIGPRLNAAGRMDDADAALNLLLERDPNRAREIARELESRNQRRRDLTSEAVDQAQTAMEAGELPFFLFYQSDAAPVGVLGLVASRLTDRFYRPSAAVRRDGQLARGSLRSIPEFNVVEALEACADLLERYGGHALAAGFSATVDRLPEIQGRLEDIASDALGDVDLREELRLDAVVSCEDLNWAVYDAIDALEPFGEGNPRPLLCVRNAPVKGAKVVGSDHLRFQIDAGPGRGLIGAIAFGQGDRYETLPDRLDVAGVLRAGEWSGRRYLELKVKDFQPAGTES